MFKASPDTACRHNTQTHMGFANTAIPTKRQILKGVQSQSKLVPTHRHNYHTSTTNKYNPQTHMGYRLTCEYPKIIRLTVLFQLNNKINNIEGSNTQEQHTGTHKAHMGFANTAIPTKWQTLKGVQSRSKLVPTHKHTHRHTWGLPTLMYSNYMYINGKY